MASARAVSLVVTAVDTKHLRDLLTDRIHRIQRRHGFLKYHRYFIAAHVVHLFAGEFQQIGTLVEYLTGGNPAVGPRNEPNDG